MATTPAQKARREQALKDYTELVAMPAEQSRKVAVAQQSRFMDRLAQSRDKLGGLLGRWKVFDADADAIAQHIAWGDELLAKDDEASRKQRRQQYARAYVRGRSAAYNLDNEIADGTTFEVAIRDAISSVGETSEKVVAGIEKGAEKVAEKLGQAIDDISEGASTTYWLVLAAAAAAALVYANQKGRQR